MRTLVDIPQADRSWLNRRAKTEGVSMAEALRRTLREAREIENQKRDDFLRLLKKTQGSWKKGDALAWQKKLRAEWDR